MPSSVSLGIINKILTQDYDTGKFSHIVCALWYKDFCKSTCTIGLNNRKRTTKKRFILSSCTFPVFNSLKLSEREDTGLEGWYAKQINYPNKWKMYIF